MDHFSILSLIYREFTLQCKKTWIPLFAFVQFQYLYIIVSDEKQLYQLEYSGNVLFASSLTRFTHFLSYLAHHLFPHPHWHSVILFHVFVIQLDSLIKVCVPSVNFPNLLNFFNLYTLRLTFVLLNYMGFDIRIISYFCDRITQNGVTAINKQKQNKQKAQIPSSISPSPRPLELLIF